MESSSAEKRWLGVTYTDYVWVCILMEEVGEVARSVHDSHYNRIPGDWRGDLVRELVQVASVAQRFAAWVESQPTAE